MLRYENVSQDGKSGDADAWDLSFPLDRNKKSPAEMRTIFSQDPRGARLFELSDRPI